MSTRPRVLLPNGWVEGVSEPGLLVFRGIPFGRSTAGGERFRAPRPAVEWPGTLDASRFGQASAQVVGGAARLRRWSAVPPRSGAGEGCLNLNVWTPAADRGRRPVMVWLHGGGFSRGSGSFHLYSGDRLARHGNVVVVSINYRLGALGGLDLSAFGGGETTDSNRALRDQVVALEWVQANVEALGGDPENVTLFGQSAGAMSIASLMVAPLRAGLFQRAILQSGAGDNVLTPKQARHVAEVFLRAMGLDPDARDVVGLLREVDWPSLVAAQMKTVSAHALPLGTLAWQPVMDGDLVPGRPRELLGAGRGLEIPLLIGTNLDEWKMFTALDKRRRTLDEATLRSYLLRTFALSSEWKAGRAEPKAAEDQTERALALYGKVPDGGQRSPADIWAAVQRDRVFRHPAVLFADAHSRRDAPTWFYRFDWRPPLAPRRVGACHSLELAFVFGTLRTPWLRALFGASSRALSLSHRMQDAWLMFARTGDPNGGDQPEWPRYRPPKGKLAVLGADFTQDFSMEEELRNFWDQVRAEVVSPAQDP